MAYARFLNDDVDSPEEAGEFLRECIKINAGDSRAIASYAKLLHTHYNDVGLADRYFRLGAFPQAACRVCWLEERASPCVQQSSA